MAYRSHSSMMRRHELWSYLEIISREAGYLIYDPQLDRIIEPSAGYDDSLSCYCGAM